MSQMELGATENQRLGSLLLQLRLQIDKGIPLITDNVAISTSLS